MNRLMPTAANKKTTPKYIIRFTLSMSDEAPVRKVASLLGLEKKVFIRDRKVRANHSKMFVLDLQSHNVAALLRMVIPFLVNKKNQAEKLCEFYEFKKTAAKFRTKSGTTTYRFKSGPQAGKLYTTRQQSDEYIAACDVFYLALRNRVVTNSGVVKKPIGELR